jgi:Zn-finger nucleic acid-binding protein
MRPNCPDCGKELHKIMNPKVDIYYACIHCRTSWIDKGGNGNIKSGKEL